MNLESWLAQPEEYGRKPRVRKTGAVRLMERKERRRTLGRFVLDGPPMDVDSDEMSASSVDPMDAMFDAERVAFRRQRFVMERLQSDDRTLIEGLPSDWTEEERLAYPAKPYGDEPDYETLYAAEL